MAADTNNGRTRRPRMSSRQRKLIKEMRDFTGASKSTAKALLEQFSWDIQVRYTARGRLFGCPCETVTNALLLTPTANILCVCSQHAADAFFAGNMGGAGGGGGGGGAGARAPAVDAGALRAWFETYQEPVEDGEGLPPQMAAEGVMKFCGDIGIDPEDPVVLVVSWHCRAANMCVYTRDEFEKGMRDLGCDSAAKLRAKLGSLRGALDDAETFRSVYAWCFDFAKDSGQKSMKKEIACAMWGVLFGGGRFDHLEPVANVSASACGVLFV